MKTPVHDFTGDDAIPKGATFEQTFEWLDSQGNPVVMTNRTGRMQIRKSVRDPVVIASLTTENNGMLFALGSITIRMTAQQTSAIASSTGVYDIEVVDPDGWVHRFIEGAMEFTPEVTRA